ncbi:MAG TPA: amidohydrolase, partial [Vicinamibacteria bacterium]|nr:amidohydrolase [Vicinamibacteria bacterium]
MKRTTWRSAAAALGIASATLAFGASLALAHPPDAQRPADVLVTADAVLTLDPARPRATAIAIRAGRIVAVGDAADVKPYVGARTRRVELKGATVVPGLTDAHVHVESLGEARESIDLVGATSLAQTLERVKAGAEKRGP